MSFKLYFLFLTLAGKIYASSNTIDIEKAIKPVESITVALTGKLIVAIATLVIVGVGISYMLGNNDEKQKERLIQIVKGAALIGASASIAAIFG